ncbi:DMT family transporter [Gilvimarinus sp. F26214L]|uniref:DMT family transporter n=1 Tax=Gilvimarinus sp. DZF01 TaxID=3461371 RepID=UPI00404682F2
MQNRIAKARKRAVYAFGCLILVGSLIALSVMVMKKADGAHLPRLTFLTLAMGGAGLALIGMAVIGRQEMPLDGRSLEYGLVSGVLLAAPQALGFLAVSRVGAGFVSLSFAFPILITWLLAVLLRMERLRPARLLGVVLGLSAGLLLASGQAGAPNVGLGWSLVVLAMPLLLAIGNIYRSARWPERGGPIYLAALMMLGAALSLAPVAMVAEAGRFSELFAGGVPHTLLLAETAIFSVLYLFFFILQKIAGPVYLSQIGIVAALVGTIIAVFALNESPPPNLLLAAILVVGGSLLFHWGGSIATTAQVEDE